MNAVVFDRLNHLQFCEDYPMPVCRPGWAVVKVMSAGICATDLEILKGAFGQPPCVIGHEICGIVTEAAPDVTACRVGDRVVVETAVSCGHCAHCQSGNKHLCESCIEVGFPQIDGGYAQYVACPAGCLHKIPENMSYDEGGILEACLCPFGLIYRNGMHLDETVLIQGAGVAGLSFLQSVKLFSPRKVLVVVRRSSAEKLAYRFGADVVINTAREDLFLRVAEETGGLGVTLSIDAAGAKTTIENAVKLTAKGGRCILYGLPNRQTQIDFPVTDIILKQLTILGGTNNQLAWNPLIRYVAAGKFNVKGMVSQTFLLQEHETALQTVRTRPEGFLKAVFHPWSDRKENL